MPENEDALAMVRALRDEMKALRGEMVAMGQDHEDKMRAMDEEHRDEMTSLGEGHKALEADLRGEIQRLDVSQHATAVANLECLPPDGANTRDEDDDPSPTLRRGNSPCWGPRSRRIGVR